MAEAAVTRRRSDPWIHRLYDALPASPIWVGVGIALALGAAFVALEIALGRHELLRTLRDDEGALRDVRLAFVNFLLVGYAPTAYLYIVRGVRRRVDALRPLFDPRDDEARALADAAGSYGAFGLRVAGLLGVAVTFCIPFFTQGAEFAYRPSHWSPEVVWHRICAPFIGWWAFRFSWAVLVESSRLSKLALRLPSVDLFDLRPLAPFAGQGLANVLLGIGFVAISALLLIESDFGVIFTILVVPSLAVSVAGLLLPVHGAHLRIHAVKQAELAWCREGLRRERAALGARGADGRGPLAELLAYQTFLEGVREWPFDPSTLVRLGFYLLIPLGSWAGGALAERVIDGLLG